MKAVIYRLCTVIVCFAILISVSGCRNVSGEGSLPDQQDTTPVQPEQDGQDGQNGGPAPAGGLIPGLDADNYPRIDASTACLPLLAKLYSEVAGIPIEEAEKLINVSGGTGAVWYSMLWGDSDLLIVYEAPEGVLDEFLVDKPGANISDILKIDPIGRDGLVFLVNKKNPVDDLTTAQLQDIYTGKITDWAKVGGTPGPIAAFQRNQDSGSQTLFLKLLMDGLTPMTPPVELVEGSMGGLIESVASFDGAGGAIGFSVYYYAELMYENPDLKLLSVDGVAPSTESITTGEYPFINDFYVVIRADEPEGSPARILRDWLLTEDGAELMRSVNYIPVR